MWIAYALAGAALKGFGDIAKKQVLGKIHAVEFLTLMYMSNGILLSPLLLRATFYSFPQMVVILFRSLLMFLAMLTFNKALRHMSISTVSPLSNIRPLLTVILSMILLGEMITLVQFAGIMIIIMGSYILDSGGHITHIRETMRKLVSSKYMLYLFLYAFFISLVNILSKVILEQVDALDLLIYHNIFMFMFFGSLTFFVFEGHKDIADGLYKSGVWIVLAGILGASASYTIYRAFADPASQVSLVVPLVQISVLLSVILGGRLFKEENLMLKLAASVLMILGVFLLA